MNTSKELVLIAREIVAYSFSDFERALKSHDWTYSNSDDHSYWLRGEQQRKELEQMARELVEVDPARVESLYNKYGRLGWGRGWKDVSADIWLNMNRHDGEMMAYRKTLEGEMRKFGRLLGQVVKGEWKDAGWAGEPPEFRLWVRDNDGSEWNVVLSGSRGRSLVGIFKNSLVAQESVDESYGYLGGLSPAGLRQVLDKMYQDLHRRGVIAAAKKTAMYQPTGEFKSMVGWKTIAFRETEKVSNEIENVLADLETYITKESFHSTQRKLGRLEQSASDAAKAYQAIAELCKNLSGRINIGLGTEGE